MLSSCSRMENAGFQFPSNGKAHSDCSMSQRRQQSRFCFNSLQTGRHIQTGIEAGIMNAEKIVVSIPFKREGTFRPKKVTAAPTAAAEFQFPSNGKAHLDTRPTTNSKPPISTKVSIPFKREGTFRPWWH